MVILPIEFSGNSEYDMNNMQERSIYLANS